MDMHAGSTATGHRPAPTLRRYTGVAMTLHWVIALAVLLLIGSGLTMTRLSPGPVAFDLYQWHKALGITVLALTIVRVLWRLGHRPPPLPPGMPPLERAAAKAGHAGFYVLLVALPLTGWAMVSWSPLNIPTTWFNLFTIPHLPGPGDAEVREGLEQVLKTTHEIAGWIMAALVLLHVAAAVRHALILRDDVLQRMVPAEAPRGRHLALLLTPVAVLAVVIVGMGARETAPAGTAAPRTDIAADGWVVDPDRSRLGFRGTQMGSPFEGRFSRFTADIRFDPDRPEDGHVVVVVDTASAVTGDTQRDGAMPGDDWFAAARHPEARFEARDIRRTGTDSYDAIGTLTIRGISHPIVLPFTLTRDDGATRARGQVELVRTDFGVGQGQWSSGSWVALEVLVSIDIFARPAGNAAGG